MNHSIQEHPFFPTHDPIVGIFLGKMLTAGEGRASSTLLLCGTIDTVEFSLSASPNEEGFEIEGGFTDIRMQTQDFLSDLMPHLSINPDGGFWGAAKEMRVRSLMQVRESLGGKTLRGVHQASLVSEDAQSQTDLYETQFQGRNVKFGSALTLERQKTAMPGKKNSMRLVPVKGEIALNVETTSGSEKVGLGAPQPLALSIEQNGSVWKVSGEFVTRSQDGTGQAKEVKEPVSQLYRILQMPFVGIPYIEVDSKAGEKEAHYFIAPIQGLIQLSAIVSRFLTKISGKKVMVPPFMALQSAKIVAQNPAALKNAQVHLPLQSRRGLKKGLFAKES